MEKRTGPATRLIVFALCSALVLVSPGPSAYAAVVQIIPGKSAAPIGAGAGMSGVVRNGVSNDGLNIRLSLNPVGLTNAGMAGPASHDTAKPGVALVAPAERPRLEQATAPQQVSAEVIYQGADLQVPQGGERRFVTSASRLAGSSDARAAVMVATIKGGVAAWGSSRRLENMAEPPILAVPSAAAPELDRRTEAAGMGARPAPPAASAVDASRARPRAARAAFIAGAVLVAAAAAAFIAPALIPAAIAVAKGPALWAGLALLNLSRYWRVPGAGAESPRGPPMAAGSPSFFKALWAAARGGADAQAALEARVGGSSAKSWRDWFLGGLRAAAVWMPVALATMMAGWGLAKPLARFADPSDTRGTISFDALWHGTLGGHMLGYIASALATQAATLAVFDLVRAVASRLGAGSSAGLVAGAVAMAVSAALILSVTTVPAVVCPMLGIEAALLWLRARSGSWLAPLALRGLLSLMSLQSARLAVGMLMGGAGVLAGLPAVWPGLAVAVMLAAALAWSAGSLKPAALWQALRAQARRVADFGAAWRAPAPDGAPKSPWALFKLASLWGIITYVLGDVPYSIIQAFTGGSEPVPAVLAQMLSAPADLVLANFLLVGFLEEFVFRRNLFKPLAARLEKWGLTGRKSFWIAALASALIFSGAHYIDYGALLAKIGLADSAAMSGLGGAYAFTLAGFATRAILGVLLAWLYAASGTLLLPIMAHFMADSFEGLGLHWGLIPFLAMAAGTILLQYVRKNKKGRTAGSRR